MKTYQYTDSTNTVVHIIDADGISRSSCLAGVVPEGEAIIPADPAPVIVPRVVSIRQAQRALLEADLLDDVDAFVATLTRAQQIEWQKASEVWRDNPLVEVIRQQKGMTEQQIDDLFLLAATF